MDTVGAAEALRGRVLHTDRNDVELPDDAVFIRGYSGLSASMTADRSVLVGRVRDNADLHPAHDMYEYEERMGGLVYVPAAKPFFEKDRYGGRRDLH